MNSYGAISTQSSQFRPTTSQPGPTGLYQEATSVPPNHTQATPPPSHPQGPLRPYSIEELEERVKQALGDDATRRSLTTWLRIAENARRGAKTFYEQGELELAFEEYAKAATIVLEKISAHPDYRVLLSTTQRYNMGLNGQEILDSLAELKISIMNRHEQWRPDSFFLSSFSPKVVLFPRDCLNRFTSIALINTARNRETCGLLLGNDKGGRYVVTTLLIPKQHATSDSFAIDEEDLVIRFREERSLITFGWIHTHPKQSCFMSSLDLHTHSGFQRMLPEAFAVVCAPNSTPNFGVFQLTSQGLQTILECQATEAFHTHFNPSIYTDADKGHVKITADLPLEIVDLRGHTTLESTNGEGLIALPSRSRALAHPSNDAVEVFMEPSSRYRHSEGASLGEEENEETASATRTVAGNDGPISELEAPKQHRAAFPPSKPPARPRGGITEAFLQLKMSEYNRTLTPRNATSAAQAVANPTVEISEGFDMLDRVHGPERYTGYSQQADYLRILQDRFGTPGPDRGHPYSYTDDTSINNGGYGNFLKNVVDPDNESYNGQHSLKSVSKRSVLTPSIASPDSSQVTSISN